MSDAKVDGADTSEVVMSKAYAVGASFKGEQILPVLNALISLVIMIKKKNHLYVSASHFSMIHVSGNHYYVALGFLLFLFPLFFGWEKIWPNKEGILSISRLQFKYSLQAQIYQVVHLFLVRTASTWRTCCFCLAYIF